ncbi:MAG: hypothetical protein ABGW98_11010, partial [Myxococcales bacterium]
MIEGNLLSDAALEQVYAVIRHFLRTERASTEHRETQRGRIPSRFPIHAVILDEDLDAADFLGTPTGSTDLAQPNATICELDTSTGIYKQTTRRLAVVNRSSTDHSEDTPGAAIPVNGHYWFFGDCESIVDRPTPPWDEEEE